MVVNRCVWYISSGIYEKYCRASGLQSNVRWNGWSWKRLDRLRASASRCSMTLRLNTHRATTTDNHGQLTSYCGDLYMQYTAGMQLGTPSQSGTLSGQILKHKILKLLTWPYHLPPQTGLLILLSRFQCLENDPLLFCVYYQVKSLPYLLFLKSENINC